MNCSDWCYYNHALIPNCAPHETPNLNTINQCVKLTKSGG